MIGVRAVAIVTFMGLVCASCRGGHNGLPVAEDLPKVMGAKSLAEQTKILHMYDEEIEKATAAEKDERYVEALYHYERALEYGVEDEGGTEYSIRELLQLHVGPEKKDIAKLFDLLEVVGTYKGFETTKKYLLTSIRDAVDIPCYYGHNCLPLEVEWAHVTGACVAWWYVNKDRLKWDEGKQKFLVVPLQSSDGSGDRLRNCPGSK